MLGLARMESGRESVPQTSLLARMNCSLSCLRGEVPEACFEYSSGAAIPVERGDESWLHACSVHGTL